MTADVEVAFWTRAMKLHKAQLIATEREVEKLKHWIEQDEERVRKALSVVADTPTAQG